jgi:hypothetical protein
MFICRVHLQAPALLDSTPPIDFTPQIHTLYISQPVLIHPNTGNQKQGRKRRESALLQERCDVKKIVLFVP